MKPNADKRRCGGSGRRGVSANELAEMGFCEKRVLLTYLHGPRTTPSQRGRIEQGRIAHELYYAEGVAFASGDRRCFIATCVFGEAAPRTHALRVNRDAVLLPKWWGPLAVGVYYWLRPSVCVVLHRVPRLHATMRVVLDFVATRCRKAMAARNSQ